jgi:PAS domain S-box-containing protein
MSNNIKKQVEELEKKHRFVSDNLIDAIWTINVETMKFDYITESIEKISGFTAKEYLNSSIEDRLTPESLQEITAIIAEEIPKFEKGKKNVRTVEVELIHKNGTHYWIEIRAKLIKEGGKHLKLVGVTREINKQKKAEHRQNELIEKLEKTLAEKDRLHKEVKILRSLLPICSGCKRIRDENGKWWPLDAYIRNFTDSEFTHTICLDCKDVFYPDL